MNVATTATVTPQRSSPRGPDREAPRPAVVGKVARLLGAFGGEQHFLGLSELARICELPKATVYRIAGALVHEGLLERYGDQYVLGGRMFELGQQVPRTRLYRDTALPFMEDLYVATGQTVHLAVLDGLDVLYIEKIMGHHGVTAPSRVAGRMPLHCTASGKVMLAYGPPDLIRRVIEAGLPAHTRYSIRSPAQLDEQVHEVRQLGVAIEREEARLGHGSIAGPVLGRSGLAIAALSVTTVLARSDPAQWAPQVKQATTQLTHALETSRW